MHQFVAQKLAQIPGVGMVSLAGGQRPAVRVQINPGELAARGLNLADVRSAIGAASVNGPKGVFDGPLRSILMDANDQIRSVDEYRKLIVAWRDGAPVRLSDIATLSDGPEDVRTLGLFNGQPAVIVLITTQPGANVIETVNSVRAQLPLLQAQLPADVLCRTRSSGPARLSALAWVPEDLADSAQKFHRNSGLVDGGLLLLAMFMLMTALISREWIYVLFAAWLVANLRMAAISAGWDGQWRRHGGLGGAGPQLDHRLLHAHVLVAAPVAVLELRHGRDQDDRRARLAGGHQQAGAKSFCQCADYCGGTSSTLPLNGDWIFVPGGMPRTSSGRPCVSCGSVTKPGLP